MKDVQFFVAAIFNSAKTNVSKIHKVLQDEFGKINLISKEYDFDFTHYYEDEMGEGLKRVFFSIEKCSPPFMLAKFKQKTINIETDFFSEGLKRFVNLDPGYLDETKIVLASTKFGNHKIAISEEVYADFVLQFKRGFYTSFDWTFPDFKTHSYDDFFMMVRKNYLGSRE